MNSVEQIKQVLREEIKAAIVEAGLAEVQDIPDILLETPKEKSHGDYASNVAMQLARIAKKAPKQIAEEITQRLNQEKASVAKVNIAGPGFINFYMDNSYLLDVITDVLAKPDTYGASDIGRGEKVLVEYVSANPTGTLHLGHARGAAVGDAMVRIMEKAGYQMGREYYINDAGNQINNLAYSVEARYKQALGMDAEMPEDGYNGKDIIEMGQELADAEGDAYLKLEDEARLKALRTFGLNKALDKIKLDLTDYRVTFDTWFSEMSLYESGVIDRTLDVLRKQDEIFEEDGATWLKTTKYGDDKDRVLIKKDGSYTYLLPDIAYHEDKFNRGYDRLIDMMGADHHGYIARMKAAVEALGYDREKLDIQITQMVSLVQGGEKVKMSKRTGKAVTLRELMEEVGLDATRYFFAMRSLDTQLDFDMDLAVSKSNENPVFYVQYAHARVCSMLRQGEEMGLSFSESTDLTPVSSEKEYDLLKAIGDFPAVVADAATKRTPHKVANYVHELASLLHSFYNAERVLDPEDTKKTEARLALMKATQITLQSGLDLLGVSAPEKM
ncbi:arginine--tRNA ligase [Alkalicoccobacillus murimartini]|uniref:Arginine--tRNA ligase n=1 Tax=Alkalicoccobacillus murimartini TaxID=171685 RepID=A0ABT9YGV6_9BACI|nr:arginine--tRNA ligase [Alkalicoccobacillus murimartini]MDQ0207077.1 arginyl-tRNA synthetase [Alkalicoccobacillus murimartini]